MALLIEIRDDVLIVEGVPERQPTGGHGCGPRLSLQAPGWQAGGVQTTRYGLKVTSSLSMDQADKRIRQALADEGFGVLTEIDLAATLQAKLGLQMAPYRILGACRPPLAAAAVQSEPDIGLLLPCNVVLYAEDDHTVVAALDPHTMVELTGNTAMADVAEDARNRLERALQTVAE